MIPPFSECWKAFYWKTSLSIGPACAQCDTNFGENSSSVWRMLQAETHKFEHHWQGTGTFPFMLNKQTHLVVLRSIILLTYTLTLCDCQYKVTEPIYYGILRLFLQLN